MDEHGPFIDAGGPDTDLVVRGTCIRLYDTGPEIHANPAHVSTGVREAYIHPDDGWLRVDHDGSYPVVAILCSPDETITARGILAGASGGTNYSRVRFTEVTPAGPVPLDLRDPAQYAKVASSGSNLWYAVVQVRQRTQGQPSQGDRLAARLAALTARVAALESSGGTLMEQAGLVTDILETGLVSLEEGAP